MKFHSQVFSTASGSTAGVTYARSASGLVARARAVPVHRSSIRQVRAQTALASLNTSWSQTLTPPQRTSWIYYAAGCGCRDVPQEGRGKFLAANVPRVSVGLAPILAAPATLDLGRPVVGILTFQQFATFVSVGCRIGTGGLSANASLFLYCGPAVSAGVNRFHGAYSLAGTLASFTGFVQPTFFLTFGTTWLLPARPSPGQRLPIRVVVGYNDGRVSADFRQVVAVTA